MPPKSIINTVTPWPPAAPFPADELPAYLADPAGPGPSDPAWEAALLASARERARELALALTGAGVAEDVEPGPFRTGPASVPPRRDISAGFLRLMELPGRRLAGMLEDWWREAGAARACAGVVAVGPGLRLGEPLGDRRGGWIMHGAIRRLTGVHWIPVVIDLWPYHDDWTMATMSPEGRVLRSRRYFRSGHAALDRLAATLAATPAGRAS